MKCVVSRRLLAIVALALTLPAIGACKKDQPSTAPAIRADDPPPAVASAEASQKKGAARPSAVDPLNEPPRWGTRPPHDGPFYPVLDGRCIHAELWALEGGTLLTYDATIENYGNGTPPAFGLFTGDGISVDEAIAKGFDPKAASSGNVEQVIGRWPDGVVLQLDRNSRMTHKSQLWIRSSAGWRLAAADEEAGDGDVPEKNVAAEAPFLRGDDVVFEEFKSIGDTSRYWGGPRALSLAEGGHAAPVPALVRVRDQAGERLLSGATWNGELFALSTVFEDNTLVVRYTRAGALREERLPSNEHLPRLGKARGFVYLASPTKLTRYDGNAWAPDVATDGLLARRQTKLLDASPDADDGVWLSLEDGGLFVRQADGSVVDRSLPDATPDAGGKAAPHGEYVARSGGTLSGLLKRDPWAIGRSGKLFHWVSGAWQAVALPAPPFARGAYVPEAVVVAAPGDVFVNAGYSVKDPGWKMPDRYRAILRTRRPREVLRCEPSTSVGDKAVAAAIGSAPPRADDACAHPFVLFTSETGTRRVDGADVMKAARAALRGRAALGERAALVQLHVRGRKYLGFKPPSVEQGYGIAEAFGKNIDAEPEVVCGEPEVEKTMLVDVASGEEVKERP